MTLNRADVLIDGGAELELGWLPPLLESARNKKIAVGAPGRIVGSEGIQLMDIPTSFDRAKGDIHALGNPHFMIDPVRAKTVAAHIATTFSQLEPSSAPTFQANLKKFNAAIDAKMVQWQKQLAPYKGGKIVTYHKDFPYFTERFGLEIVEQLEPKPGIAPSPAHLAQVISTMRSTGAKVILLQPYQNRRTAQTVARQTGAVVLDMPQQPGAIKNVNGYIELIDYLVTTLANGLKGAR